MKTQFGKGLFIKNDDNGNPCHIGDIVRVKVSGGESTWNDLDVPLNDAEYEGVLVLLKSKGVYIRLNNGYYIQPRLTKNSMRKWEWELIKSNQ